MNTKPWNRIFAVALIPVIALSGTLFLAAGRARTTAASFEGDWPHSHALVGVWNVTVQLYDCSTEAPVGKPFISRLTFNEGGTMTGSTTNPAFAVGQRSDDQGVWSVDDHAYSAKSAAYILFTTAPNLTSVPPNPGFQAGTQTITQKIEIDDANHFTSDARVFFYDATGTSYRQGCASATAERFQ